MSLSLCMIVKNEQDNLPRCLESVKRIVDEMIIVDTGSTDSTVDIAKSFSAKVYHFPWNGNFSNARNYSLKFAACDWILLMDADDELDPSDQDAVIQLTRSTDAEAYFFETISYIGDKPGLDVMKNLNMRLIRNGKGYFFSNPIHEQIYTNIKAINPDARILTEDIKVYHYGYLNKNITSQNKRQRNISILEKELEQYPDYGFALFNLGNEYFALGDNSKAFEYYEKSYGKFDPNQGFSSKLVLKMVNCLMNLARYDHAIKLIDDGLKYYPEFTDLEYMRGLIYSGLGKYLPGIRAFKRCIEMGEASSYFNIIIGAGTYRSHFALGDIYYGLDEYDEALTCYKNAIHENPQFTPALINYIKTLCSKRTGIKSLTDQIEEMRKIAPDNYYTIVYDILIQEKYFDLALKYIQKSEKIFGVTSNSIYFKGLCKLFLKKYKSTYSILEPLKKDPEYAVRAICSQALCKILENKHAQATEILSNDKLNPNDKIIKVYSLLNLLLETGNSYILSDDEDESSQYSVIIFDLLKILMIVNEFELFEKALNLLNTINDKTVLLKLAKLYYRGNCHSLSYQEFIRSLKLFDLIDIEGVNILQKLKYKGY